MQEALPGCIAVVVGNQGQYHHADDVGGEGNGNDQYRQRNVAEQGVAANDVQVQQAECFEGEERLQASAGVGNQQLVLPDLQDDAAAGDGVAHSVEHIFGHVGDRQLHRHGQRTHHRAGQRDHEEEEEERKPRGAQGRPAAHNEQQPGDDDDLRADFKEQDVLRAAENVKQQTEDKDRPAGLGGRGGQVVDGDALLPEEPEGDAKDDRAVGLGFGGPDAAREIHPSGDIKRNEANEDGEPLGDGRALGCGQARVVRRGVTHCRPLVGQSANFDDALGVLR